MKIYAIVVTYNPEFNRLRELIKSLLSQVDKIILINNNSCALEIDNNDKISIIELHENKGIAFAQNRGIELAEEEKADFVLLSDQDTVYPSDYINSFMKYIDRDVADIFCPVFYDNIKKIYSPIMIKKFKSISESNKEVYVAHAIASGTLININVFKDVGLMNEKLFIDYVDFEWCWRATYCGKKIITIPSVIINHNLGDGIKKILWKSVTVRSNFRYFYILRNGFYLSFHCKYLNISEKLHLLCRTVSFSLGVILLRHNFEIIKIVFKAFVIGGTGSFINE